MAHESGLWKASSKSTNVYDDEKELRTTTRPVSVDMSSGRLPDVFRGRRAQWKLNDQGRIKIKEIK
jgi:hypothetical protein